MAEFCKKCFVEKILNTSEQMDYYKGKLKIIMFEDSDFCEGCGEIAQVVNYVTSED